MYCKLIILVLLAIFFMSTCFSATISGNSEGCESPPSTPMNGKLTCSQSSGCRATCLSNFQFPNKQNELIITCKNAVWQIEGTKLDHIPSCEPICEPSCLNSGTCIAPNTCSCPENFSGTHCELEKKSCLNYPPMTLNSKRRCSSTSCTTTCLDGYQFPDGSSMANMTCKKGSWVPEKPDWTSIPDCQAASNPPDQNGSNRLTGCESFPSTPTNGKLTCSKSSGCQANCPSNYQFPNKQNQLIIICKDDKWQIEGTKLDHVPSCEPICEPSCLNSGTCVAPNVCSCPESFSGTRCELKKKSCLNYPPMPVNSQRRCSSTLCTITCMNGHQFPDGSSVVKMTCKGDLWVLEKENWTSIPDCQAV